LRHTPAKRAVNIANPGGNASAILPK